MIGLCGKAGSGKNTSAEYFEKYDSELIAFADPLKTAVKALFDLSDKQITDTVLKETVDIRWGKSPRQMMQIIGMELREKFGYDVFIKNLNNRIDLNCRKYVIITDVRFPNECEYIKRNGGIILHIKKPCSSADEHCSENQILDKYIDYTITNDGTVEELHNKIKLFLQINNV